MSCEARWKVEGSLYRGLTSIYFEFTSKLLHRCESRGIYLLISWIFLYANLIRTDMMRNRLKDKAMYWLWRTLVLTMRITSVTENSTYYFPLSATRPCVRACVCLRRRSVWPCVSPHPHSTLVVLNVFEHTEAEIFCGRHFRIQFCECKLLYFDSNFTQVCFH